MITVSRPPALLDARKIPLREKYPLIFGTFDALRSGESFVIVYDYDPSPLWHHFSQTRASLFRWEYLERGPVVWRVEISRR